ncbi:condensation domain-containing protein [Lysinibacillus sphaericus]
MVYTDGQIEYAGRMDQQVKLRGYRIELQEIESHLESMAPVREAAAAVHNDSSGDAYLCGYLVWKDGEKALPLESVKAELAGKLPSYMVPDHFVWLEELPQTANGKLDRKALPEPEREAAGYEAPETETEKQLAQIWSGVLGVEECGIEDNFFDLGGHSLKATILVGKVKRILKKELPLSEVFTSPTIRELSARLDNLDNVFVQDIQPAASRKFYPLSSSQRRLFVLSQFPEIETSYNMPAAWLIKGDLKLEQLKAALELIADRHDILRTVFKVVGGEPVQQIQETVKIKIECQNSTEKGLTEAIDRFVRPFNLEESPLFRTGLIKIENDHHLLLFDMHHIVSDGTSIQILVKDIMNAYNGRSPQRGGLQYKDYAVWQDKHGSSGMWN